MKRQPIPPTGSPQGRPRQPGADSRVTALRLHSAPEGSGAADLLDLVDALPQAVFCADGQERWSWLSAGWSRMTGFDTAASLGRACRDFVHPADRPRFDRQVESLGAGEEHDAVLRVRFVCSDGEPRWMEMHASPAVSRTEGAQIVGTLTNVTSRVAEENQRRAAQRTVASLINDLPGMVYRCRNNRDWTMEYVSRGALDLTGYEPEDLIDNHTLSYASLIHVDDNERVWDEVQLAVNAGQPFDLVYRIVTAAGELKWVWERGRGILTTSGELLGLEGFITDITRERVDREALDRGALYEAATGLPTAALFMDRINLALRRYAAGTGSPPVLLVVHLDRFSRVARDGPAAGRAASHAVVRAIANVLAATDTLTRLQDERFGVLIERPDGRTAAVHTAATIRDALRAPIPVDDQALYLTASIGIAVDIADSADADHLVATALQAANRARALGGDRYHVHDRAEGRDTP